MYMWEMIMVNMYTGEHRDLVITIHAAEYPDATPRDLWVKAAERAYDKYQEYTEEYSFIGLKLICC